MTGPIASTLAVTASLFGPQPASSLAARLDHFFAPVLVAGTLALIAIAALLLVTALRRRSSAPPPAATRGRQLLLIAVPALVAALLLPAGWQRHLDRTTLPVRAPVIKAIARVGHWEFVYPNGVTDRTLHLPVGTPIRLRLISVDYVHSLQVPALRLDQVVIPGRYTRTWVEAGRPGRYPMRCGRATGGDHPPMHGEVVIHQADGYQDYLAAKEAEIRPPGALGMAVYVERGCATCHSVDGSANTGPTFKGLYESRVTLTDGTTVVADAAYVRESIREPKAKVVSGFQPVMQSYRDILDDRAIEQFIDYLKTLR